MIENDNLDMINYHAVEKKLLRLLKVDWQGRLVRKEEVPTDFEQLDSTLLDSSNAFKCMGRLFEETAWNIVLRQCK